MHGGVGNRTRRAVYDAPSPSGKAGDFDSPIAGSTPAGATETTPHGCWKNPVFMRGFVVLQGETGSSCPRDNKLRLFPKASAPGARRTEVENPVPAGPIQRPPGAKPLFGQGEAKAVNAGFAVRFSAKAAVPVPALVPVPVPVPGAAAAAIKPAAAIHRQGQAKSSKSSKCYFCLPRSNKGKQNQANPSKSSCTCT